MTLRQAKDTAISHNAIIELQEDEHNGFAHTVWKGVFHQLPKEYLDREFKPITDYVHYEKQYEDEEYDEDDAKEWLEANYEVDEETTEDFLDAVSDMFVEDDINESFDDEFFPNEATLNE